MAVLNEKSIPFEIEYIDLRNKPAWFLEISPTGKVPVIQTAEGHVLFESAVINEFLDETHEPRMMPASPLARANDRMWSDFVSGLYGDVYRSYNAEDEEGTQAAFDGIRSRLTRLEEEITGPLFRGEHFTLVDATAAPPFTRIEWIEQIDPSVDLFANTPKAKVWKEALVSRPSVKNSVLPNIFDIFSARLKEGSSWLGSRV